MNSHEKMGLLMSIYHLIFESKTENTDITKELINDPKLLRWDWTNKTWVIGPVYGRWFVNGTLRGFDVGFDIGTKILDIRCVEQNPSTSSQYATMAQRGSRIIWVIQRDKNVWLGRIQDGEWTPAKERAYQPVQRNAAVAQTGPANMTEIPDIPNIGIPEHVIKHYEEDGYEPPWVEFPE